jgi:hypothetical protein
LALFERSSDRTAGTDPADLACDLPRRSDPEQMTGRALTIVQFRDQIPEILDAFDFKLRSQPGGAANRAADLDKKNEEVKRRRVR